LVVCQAYGIASRSMDAPNSSIERTSISKLRLLAAAADVKHQAS
jgi:hypothetical protein